ncbi:hypothetical protein OG596_01060 [Streptomyces sp. NBC_01102]|nr:hypothetical protein OG596_01060 [Streptomyces sp. NBC_01102]
MEVRDVHHSYRRHSVLRGVDLDLDARTADPGNLSQRIQPTRP